MSIQAMAWAIEIDQISDPNQKFVLMCLANYASEDGKNAFPSITTLSRHTCLSESTVRRKLQELEEGGLIIKGNQAIAVAYIEHAGRRPIVYDLSLTRGVTVTPVTVPGVSKTASRGVNDEPQGCQALTPNPSGNPSLNQRAVYNPTWEEREQAYEKARLALRLAPAQQKKVQR